MADNFFGFDTNFPTENALGQKGLSEELLTAEIEEEAYDALNDETFGCAANDDWEDAHEKLSELVVKKLLYDDDDEDEVVSKSISKLGFEDDLNDPAIMTIARGCPSIGRTFRSNSPPPPAILETEDCGSPKTHSIWSTTPKDSGISSFLQSLNHSSTSHSCHDPSALLNSSSDSVFATPPKAWHAEDLEKDLLSNKDHVHIPNSSWPQASHLNHQTNVSTNSPSGFPSNLGQNQNKIAVDRMLTREEVERQMHSDSRLCYPPVLNTAPPNPKLPWMGAMLQPNLMSPIGARGSLNSNQSSPVVPLRPPIHPMMGNGCAVPDRYFMNSRIKNMIHNQMPVRGPVLPNLPPGFNPSNMNMNHSKFMFLPPRSIAHPFLHKQFQFPMVVHNNYHGGDEMRNAYHSSEDEYAGLMTQKEKEWLIRIQMLTLKSENPYVEDYYFTTQVARRCRKKYSENASKGGGDAPELILPETTKHESRAFVPTQFEGSLGKLQAVSVNFPRKVLDITVKRSLEDDEGKVVTNQSLLRFRRLLLDIERLYSRFLEIEDEERRILAKPETESGSHRETIAKLTKEIFTGLVNSEESSEDYFQNVMIVRKGRSLLMRVFKLFSLDQQLQCLICLFRSLPVILKKDQNDLILVQHVEMITDTIQVLSFQQLVLLGETLENDALSDPSKGIEKSNVVAAFKNKFGTSVICTMLMRAEKLYPELALEESDLISRWTKVVLHFVDCLCALPNPSTAVSFAVPCSMNLLSHFQRFAVDRDKFNVLKEKLLLLAPDSAMQEV